MIADDAEAIARRLRALRSTPCATCQGTERLAVEARWERDKLMRWAPCPACAAEQGE